MFHSLKSIQFLQPRVQSDGSDGNQGSVKSSSPKYDQVLKVQPAIHERVAIFEYFLSDFV